MSSWEATGVSMDSKGKREGNERVDEPNALTQIRFYIVKAYRFTLSY